MPEDFRPLSITIPHFIAATTPETIPLLQTIESAYSVNHPLFRYRISRSLSAPAPEPGTNRTVDNIRHFKSLPFSLTTSSYVHLLISMAIFIGSSAIFHASLWGGLWIWCKWYIAGFLFTDNWTWSPTGSIQGHWYPLWYIICSKKANHNLELWFCHTYIPSVTLFHSC